MASLPLSDRKETTHIYVHTSLYWVKIDGAKAMSRGFEGAKQVMKSADVRNRSGVC